MYRRPATDMVCALKAKHMPAKTARFLGLDTNFWVELLKRLAQAPGIRGRFHEGIPALLPM